MAVFAQYPKPAYFGGGLQFKMSFLFCKGKCCLDSARKSSTNEKIITDGVNAITNSLYFDYLMFNRLLLTAEKPIAGAIRFTLNQMS